jgi:uncharacterized membrane protein YvbJ
MICPHCGKENPDSVPLCSNCHYKFRFGHAHGDPKNMMYLFSKPSEKSKKFNFVSVVFYGIILLFITIFILSIYSSFR